MAEKATGVKVMSPATTAMRPAFSRRRGGRPSASLTSSSVLLRLGGRHGQDAARPRAVGGPVRGRTRPGLSRSPSASRHVVTGDSPRRPSRLIALDVQDVVGAVLGLAVEDVDDAPPAQLHLDRSGGDEQPELHDLVFCPVLADEASP